MIYPYCQNLLSNQGTQYILWEQKLIFEMNYESERIKHLNTTFYIS